MSQKVNENNQKQRKSSENCKIQATDSNKSEERNITAKRLKTPISQIQQNHLKPVKVNENINTYQESDEKSMTSFIKTDNDKRHMNTKINIEPQVYISNQKKSNIEKKWTNSRKNSDLDMEVQELHLEKIIPSNKIKSENEKVFNPISVNSMYSTLTKSVKNSISPEIDNIYRETFEKDTDKNIESNESQNYIKQDILPRVSIKSGTRFFSKNYSKLNDDNLSSASSSLAQSPRQKSNESLKK